MRKLSCTKAVRSGTTACGWVIFLVAAELALAAEPPTAFRDCDGCPDMVVVPAGEFSMGAEPSPGIPEDESPSRLVVLDRPFAMSRFEITVAQFSRFAAETQRGAGDSCFTWIQGVAAEVTGKDWVDPGFAQTRESPAVCVTWQDATAYAAWLSEKTGQLYRLPTEAEWEYAARAGRHSTYPTGEDAYDLCEEGNVADVSAARALRDWRVVNRHVLGLTEADRSELDRRFSLVVGDVSVPWQVASCDDGYGLTTSPAGSFPANPFGLHDMLGNAWEWVADCYAETYEGAPTDGSPVPGEASCSLRGLRGGAWAMNQDGWRLTDRDRDHPERRYAVVGIRVVREWR